MNGDDTLQTLQVIQNLQLKLRKTSQEVHVRRQNAAKAEAALQSQASRHMSQAVLQQESMLALQEAFQERDAESACTERLISELQALQADLLVNEQNEMNQMNEMNEMNEDERCEKAFVDIRTHELLESELHVLQSESNAAAENNALLQATLHETNEAKRRRDELIREKVIDLRETHWHQSRRLWKRKNVAMPFPVGQWLKNTCEFLERRNRLLNNCWKTRQIWQLNWMKLIDKVLWSNTEWKDFEKEIVF